MKLLSWLMESLSFTPFREKLRLRKHPATGIFWFRIPRSLPPRPPRPSAVIHHQSPLVGFMPLFPSPTIAAGKNVPVPLWAQSKWLRTGLLQKQTRKEPGTGRSKRAPHRVIRHTPRTGGLAETRVVGKGAGPRVRVGDG